MELEILYLKNKTWELEKNTVGNIKCYTKKKEVQNVIKVEVNKVDQTWKIHFL